MINFKSLNVSGGESSVPGILCRPAPAIGSAAKLFPLMMCLALLTSCVAKRPFEPAHSETMTIRGYKAATYHIRTRPDDWGQIKVKIWTSGVHSIGEKSSPEARNAVELGMGLTNDSDQDVQLNMDRTYLDLEVKGQEESQSLQPVLSGDDLRWSPGSEKDIRLAFTIPAGIDPGDISSFVFHWTLSSAELNYSEMTRFVRDNDEESSVYYIPYDPFLYGYPYTIYYGDPYYGDLYPGAAIRFGLEMRGGTHP